jgi:AGZA family xanthine/uracil permease-like MFS transporter
MVIGLCWLGIVPVLLAAIPVVSILPILLYIGLLIGSQAFQETPRRHAPAVILALVPNVAAWALGMVKGTLTAAGVGAVTPELADKMANEGVLLHGLEVLGGGAVLTGIILAATTVFIIERQLWRASAFAAAGAILTWFGFMHGEHIGMGQSPTVAVSYLLVAGFLAECAKFAVAAPATQRHASAHEAEESSAEVAVEIR